MALSVVVMNIIGEQADQHQAYGPGVHHSSSTTHHVGAKRNNDISPNATPCQGIREKACHRACAINCPRSDAENQRVLHASVKEFNDRKCIPRCSVRKCATCRLPITLLVTKDHALFLYSHKRACPLLQKDLNHHYPPYGQIFSAQFPGLLPLA